jgi:hypothetical protein
MSPLALRKVFAIDVGCTCQLHLPAGPEHGRITPLANIPQLLWTDARISREWNGPVAMDLIVRVTPTIA